MPPPNPMIETLKDFVQRLGDLRIPYMVTGSFAMLAYATPRMTYDIDAIIEISSQEADAIENRFLSDYYVDRTSIANAVRHSSMFNVINNNTGVKVDCIIRKPTKFEIEKFARRRKTEVDGVSFWVTSKEDLILSKLAWAKDSLSEKQFSDIRNLLEGGVDEEFFQSHLELLRLQEIWAEFEKWKTRTER